MRSLIRNDDLKSLLQGAGAVALGGLLLGGAMHPNLDAGDKPKGPQMLMGGGSRGGGDYAADPGVGAYAGATPEYVIGTDWTRPKTPQYVQYAQAETGDGGDVMAYEDDAPAAPQVTRTSWREEPRAPTVYPSQRGNAYYEANLPSPPAPPDEGEGTEPN